MFIGRIREYEKRLHKSDVPADKKPVFSCLVKGSPAIPKQRHGYQLQTISTW